MSQLFRKSRTIKTLLSILKGLFLLGVAVMYTIAVVVFTADYMVQRVFLR